MSGVKNKGVVMCYKAVTDKFLTILGLLVEPIASIEKPKGYTEAYISIRQPKITLTSSNPIISPSLSILFFFISMLISNSRIHRSIGKQ